MFCREFGFWKGLWYAAFHSVSAFCNAGFDLMGVRGPFSSLTVFSSHSLVNPVIMALILIGGIGFTTWDDLRNNGIRFHKYRMQTKVILTSTLALIVLPAAYFYFGEFSGGEWAGEPAGKRVLAALFQSVTARTAGFNTADLTAMSQSGQSLLILLMLIGGAPGSTAGGIKTTTAVVLLTSTLSLFRRRETIRCFGRRIDERVVRDAVAILLMYLVLFFFGALLMSRIEGIPMLSCLFETASAIGTVGLTLGITPGLSAASRVLLIALMFVGRVGGLTLIFAAFSGVQHYAARLPMEKITVG